MRRGAWSACSSTATSIPSQALTGTTKARTARSQCIRGSSSQRCARCTARTRSRARSWGKTAREKLPLLRHDGELDVQAVLHFERAERHAERLDAEVRLQQVELAARAQLRAFDRDLHRHFDVMTCILDGDARRYLRCRERAADFRG